jgi:predicted nucleic acid-binding protein
VARETAREIIKTYGVWVRRTTTVETVTRATEIAGLEGISFRDALIVAAPEEVDAEVQLSTDYNDGQPISGINVVGPLTRWALPPMTAVRLPRPVMDPRWAG